MKCKHLIGICELTHMACPHCSVEGQCNEAECVNATIPTWRQMIDIYTVANKPTHSRLKDVLKGTMAVLKYLGASLDDKVAVTAKQFDAAAEEMGKHLKKNGVASYFAQFKTLGSTSRNIRLEYANRGLHEPFLDTPVIQLEHEEPPPLTDEQILAIDTRGAILRASKDPRDRPRFIWHFFAWNKAMRPIDICNSTWSIIKIKSDGSWWLDYVPSKTKKKCGKHAGGKLTPEEIAMIKPYVGNPDEYLIPRHPEKRAKGGCAKLEHGENVATHRAYRDEENAFCRAIGVKAKNAAYAALRGGRSQIVIKTLGVLHEAQLLGHTPKVALQFYTRLADMDLKEGL